MELVDLEHPLTMLFKVQLLSKQQRQESLVKLTQLMEGSMQIPKLKLSAPQQDYQILLRYLSSKMSGQKLRRVH